MMNAVRALILLATMMALGWPQASAQAAATAPATPATPEQSASPSKQPQVKSKEEFDAYQAALAKAANPEALESAVNDFVAKFPDSELTPQLYRAAMRAYEQANNRSKLVEMGQKVLKSDPNDPEALVSIATVTTETVRDTDLDKDQRLNQAIQDAQRALQSVDTDVPPGLSPDQVTMFKSIVRSNAYSVMGSVQLTRQQYAEAEGSLKKALEAFPSQPDPIVLLRLTLVLDKQAKYPEALKVANQVVSLTGENTQAGDLARREQQRLEKLTGGGNSPAPNPPATAPSPAPPKN